MKKLIAIILWLAVLCPAFTQPTPFTGEIVTHSTPLNEPWAHYTDHHPLDLNANGTRYVLTWFNPLPTPINNSGRVFARVFDINGTPITPEIIVGSNQNAWLVEDCSINNNGNFVVLFHGAVNTSNLYLQTFSPTGTPISGQVLVSSTEASQFPRVILDEQGNSFVIYSQPIAGGNGLFVRKYNLSGTSIAGPIQIQSSASILTSCNLKFRTDGNLAIVFTKNNIHYTVINSSLGTVVPVTQLVGPNGYSAPTVLMPGLVIKPNNDILITYNIQIGVFPNQWSTYIQAFNGSGTPLTTASQIGTPNYVVRIVGNEYGNYVGIFENSTNINIQEYSPNDLPVGNPVQVNIDQPALHDFMDASNCKLVVNWDADFSYGGDPLEKRHRVFSFGGVTPSASFTLPFQVCAGQPIPFNGTNSTDETQYNIGIYQTSGNGTTNIIATLYQGSFQGQVGAIDLSTLASFQAGNYYLVTLEVKNECSGWQKQNRWIYINPLPTANAGPDKTICNTSTQIGTSGSIGLTYSWTPNQGMSNPNVAQPYVSPLTTTTYTLTVTNTTTGCQKTDQVTVYVDQPSAPAIVTTPSSVCLGSQMCFSPQTLSSPGSTYSWTVDYINQGGSSVPVILSGPNVCYTYLTAGTRTVTLTVTNACGTFSSTKKITVRPLPTATIYLNNPPSYCDGMQMSAVGNGGTAPYTYQWSHGLGTQNSVNAIPNYSSTYTVTVTDANGCSSTASQYVAQSPYYQPITFDTPVQNVFTPNNDNFNDLWCLEDGNATTFAHHATWYKIRVYDRWGVLVYTRNANIPSYTGFSSPVVCWDGRNQSGVFVPNGQYNIVYTLRNCGYNIEFLADVTMLDGPNKMGTSASNGNAQAQSEFQTEEGLPTLFPNPTSDQINITIPLEYFPLQNIRVYSATGECVMKKEIGEGFTDQAISLQTKPLSNGCYWIEIDGVKTWRKMFVKQ